MDDHEIKAQANLILPVLEERLQVEIRQNVTGIVRLEKIIRQYEGLVDQELLHETLSIEHVPLHQYLDEPIAPRQEDRNAKNLACRGFCCLHFSEPTYA